MPKPFLRRATVVSGTILGGLCLVWLALRECGAAAEKTGRATEQVILTVSAEGQKIARKMRTGYITQTFRESAARVGATESVLELATNRVTEIFRRDHESRLFFDLIPLGTTTAEIRVDAVFRYHARLDDDWRLEAQGNICFVRAPAIRPTLPTAFDTETMEKRAQSGWARFDKAEQLAALERGLTPALDARARDEEHLNLVRDSCRRSIAEFVRLWLLREDHWRTGRFTAIVVLFPDEVQPGSDVPIGEAGGQPTLTLQSL